VSTVFTLHVGEVIVQVAAIEMADKSPARYMAARSLTAVRNTRHRAGQSFLQCSLLIARTIFHGNL
jgi:hypothetical protein